MSLDIKKGVTFHHHHVSFALIILIFLLVALVLTIRPALRGYKLNQEFEDLGTNAAEFIRQLDTFKSDILITETSLTNCQKTNEDYLVQLNNEKNETFSCNEEKRIITKEFELNLTMMKSEQGQKKSEAEIDLAQLSIEHEDLQRTVANSADNICCKNRIDNPDIDSYSISNSRIICTVGGEEKISCS